MKPFVIAAALLAAGPALAAESPLKICTNPDANLEAALRACGQVIDDRAAPQADRIAALKARAGIRRSDDKTLEAAVADATEGLRLAPLDTDLLTTRGDALLALRRLPAARADVEASLRLDPSNQLALRLLGDLLDAEDAPAEKVLAAYDAAVLNDPSDLISRLGRALSRGRVKDWAGAVADYDVVIKTEPDHSFIFKLRGDANILAGRPEAAAADYRAAVKLDPDNTEAMNGLGFMILADKPAESLALAERVLKAAPDNDGALLLKARAFYHLDRVDEAIPVLRRLNEVAPQEASGFHDLARIYLDKDQPHLAEPLIASALKLDPHDVEALGLRAELRANAEDWAGALADDDLIVSLDPSADAYHQRGLHRSGKGDAVGAMADLRKATELAPDSPSIWLSLAHQAQLGGERPVALAAVERALKLDPDSSDAWIAQGGLHADVEAWPEAAQAYLKGGATLFAGESFEAAGDTARALALYDEALKADPTWTRAWADKGELLSSLGRGRDALKAFDRGLAITPTDVRLLLGRASARSKAGDLSGAEADFDAALAAAPKSAEVFNARGLFNLERDRFDAALAELNQALALEPKMLDALFNRALVYMSQGRNDPAIRDLNALLFLEPKDYAARSLKGEAFHRLGDETRALEELNAALEMAPDDAITLLRRGRVREALGDKAAAAADKARALKLDPSLKTD